ncbi:flagellar basal body protein [Pseudoduganella violaceinigra]|uniref:flagellar basal body protein n=1 Tax=Pseudoduganella violaceinigra TaxID=246602 RepID=UPI000410B497|nr:flagellar basal body protein [Pseudoduganella violaceinigra]
MTISALQAGLSGLQANQQALGVEAHNVANLATQNFQPQQAKFQETQGGTSVTISTAARNLSAADTAGAAPSGTDPASSITNSLVYKANFDLSAKVVQAADERIGTLLDIKA